MTDLGCPFHTSGKKELQLISCPHQIGLWSSYLLVGVGWPSPVGRYHPWTCDRLYEEGSWRWAWEQTSKQSPSVVSSSAQCLPWGWWSVTCTLTGALSFSSCLFQQQKATVEQISNPLCFSVTLDLLFHQNMPHTPACVCPSLMDLLPRHVVFLFLFKLTLCIF